MTDIEALKESISDELFQKEPLARAIMSYLNQSDPNAHRIILDKFDELISIRIDRFISDALENEANSEKWPK